MPLARMTQGDEFRPTVEAPKCYARMRPMMRQCAAFGRPRGATSGEGGRLVTSVIYPDGDTGVLSVTDGQWDNNGNVAESDVTQEQTVHVDQYSGAIAARYGYDDYSAVAKAVSQRIAVHEGRRFGVVNMIATTLFCLAVIFMCVSGPIMWWTRRGTASGTAAPRAKLPVWGNRVLLMAMTALGIFLPMFGLSLLIVLALDQLLIRRVPRLRRFFRTA
ncbi:hypothetical protein E3O68_16410 [Cryobacterium sp. TMB3-1-2]|nr:hypothetical protein E3O68_16410 [Cryobacterium sp. TMB3-1-2]TFC74434.1 hypothetical protein E3T21_02700 [Cryobacterium sp. TMB3-15]TFC79947.1 hypothetical protein E3T22_00975 [Cryobacterium sp. TMB3-10]TFD41848.1 hypothetical protein E3T58_10305 [Cryobacterium sp. TMB3-12]